MDSLKAKDSVEVNAKKDSVQRSLIQFNADNQNSIQTTKIQNK